MIFARLVPGSVAMRDGQKGVVLQTDGANVAIAPIERATLPLLRGDVEVDPVDVGLPGSSGSDRLVIRCGAAVSAPAAGQVAIALISKTLLLTLRQETLRAAEGRARDRVTRSPMVCTLLSTGIGSRGRRVGRAGLG